MERREIMIEVIPCPFCGCKKVHYRFVDGSKWGAACCVECGAQAGEVRTSYDESEDTPWHKEALKEWNTRI